MINTTIIRLRTFGVLFFFNHRISGRKRSAINIEEINGMKMKDRVLSI